MEVVQPQLTSFTPYGHAQHVPCRIWGPFIVSIAESLAESIAGPTGHEAVQSRHWFRIFFCW